MSRHRAVRNLDIDDILDEDEYDSEYDENQLDETEMSNEDLDKLDEGLAYVYSVIGEDTILSAKEIKEAMWYYYFDREETIEWAFEKIAKEQAIRDKKKAKEEAKKASRKITMTDKPSLSSLSNARQIPTNSLAQLKQKMQKPSLASLASTNTSKPVSSLQSLAQRANTTTTITPSLASLAQKSTPANKTNSLAHLASRNTTNATTTTSSSSNSLLKLGSLASLASRNQQQQQQPAAAKPITVLKAPEVPVITTTAPKEEEEEEFENPLIAKPSLAAQFLFKPQPKVFPQTQEIFEKAMKKPTSIHVFAFDQPSPDDIVLAAQSQRGGANKKN